MSMDTGDRDQGRTRRGRAAAPGGRPILHPQGTERKAATSRRRVDWPIIMGPKIPVPTVMDRSAPGHEASLLAAFDDILALDDPQLVLKRAVEVARERIGLARVGLFLLDRSRN